jgi:hypothetical protein
MLVVWCFIVGMRLLAGIVSCCPVGGRWFGVSGWCRLVLRATTADFASRVVPVQIRTGPGSMLIAGSGRRIWTRSIADRWIGAVANYTWVVSTSGHTPWF